MGKQEHLTKAEIALEKAAFQVFVKAYQRRTGANLHAACSAWKAHLIEQEKERLAQERAAKHAKERKLQELYHNPAFLKYLYG